MINEKLLKAQGVEHNREEIEKLHQRIEYLFEYVEETAPSCYESPIVGYLEGIEYQLQALWGFPLDRNRHTWWLLLPGCTCPPMDNADLWGTDKRWYNTGCPWHGDESVYRKQKEGE
jgi:hypothetical protein